ncbi:uncharacterized protein LOC124619691 [Schistocerca americana]|uniref:uncharacterized protein LOC124619691 n=1 Tax=Schistocerca americana TaxID=7009 RepID=UPI001F5027A6|nr:uncharacterized protein LOC124619691 [Schistocerca americana]
MSARCCSPTTKLQGLLLLLFILGFSYEVDGQALFFRNDLSKQSPGDGTRLSRQAQTDLTVRTIIDWLQGRYTNPARRGVQDSTLSQSEPARTYLPVPVPGSERPRPFQPNPTATPPPSRPFYPFGGQNNGQYPQLPPPQPPFGEGPQTSQSSGVYLPPSTEAFPPYIPPVTTTTTTTTTPAPEENLVPSGPGTGDGEVTGGGEVVPTGEGETGPGVGPTGGDEMPTVIPTDGAEVPTVSPTGGADVIGDTGTGSTEIPTGSTEDEAHPPHIHSIDVVCSKEEMTINIEFNRPFNGVIYSKNYYRNPACRYVAPNSGQTKYSFTVKLNDECGTQFIDKFKEGGQAYLENVLVLQNEPGIQEVWDTARRVRCLWEGSIKQSLNVNLNVDMLNQETVTFSGDTGKARLEIQVGKGPFAPPASGLVKIGETMTLVVYVEGDPGFDIRVQQCVARDANSDNVVELTDERGCILKPKLIGAFQKTKDTGSSSASVIAYAYFQAFKFPDIMDLIFECNVELCKVECEGCPTPGQSLNPISRRRRDLWTDNSTDGEPLKVFRSFRVIAPEDIDDLDALTGSRSTVINIGSYSDGICMSMPAFLVVSVLLLTVLVTSCLTTAYLWLKRQRKSSENNVEDKKWRMDAYHVSKS